MVGVDEKKTAKAFILKHQGKRIHKKYLNASKISVNGQENGHLQTCGDSDRDVQSFFIIYKCIIIVIVYKYTVVLNAVET